MLVVGIVIGVTFSKTVRRFKFTIKAILIVYYMSWCVTITQVALYQAIVFPFLYIAYIAVTVSLSFFRVSPNLSNVLEDTNCILTFCDRNGCMLKRSHNDQPTPDLRKT